ncbi:MAG: universal stress protein [Chitinophagaceae bacterium]|nr:universal stress protein [Chitinophagaceae bacterium]
MHRVIIPVDFSETSLNAARFTARMLAGNKDAMAILYHNYESHDDIDVSHNFQESLKKEFIRAGVANVVCENEMGGDLVDNIARMAHTIRATLIAMGITGKSAIRQALVGSNTLKLVDKNLYPVMIIPPDAIYNGISNVAFASDFRNVENTTPAPLITSVLELFDPKLHILHVSREPYAALPAELEAEKNSLLEMFNRFKTEVHLLAGHDFYKAVDDFVKDHAIDVLITIPKHQSNSTSIFKTTHTKHLAYHSHIPVLAAHE